MFSFATKKGSCKKLELIRTSEEETAPSAAVQFKVLSTGLSANNNFYLNFGEKAPFNFFQAYPVPKGSILVDSDNMEKITTTATDYVHPPVWGLCEVTQSTMESVPVGSVYRAMLPLGTQVHFTRAKVEPTLGNLIIHRPTTHSAYNLFTPIPSESVSHPKNSQTSGLALTCYPGILTGLGLYFSLHHANYYNCDTIVVSSASSKVALAFALYMKDTRDKNVIGYTSESNKHFCESTGLYSKILTYDEVLSETVGRVVMVDISGRGTIYTNNQSHVKKLLCIGNTSGTPANASTFTSFTAYAKVKLVLTMMGGPKWICSRMNPTQELFLIMDTLQEMLEEWGKEHYLKTFEDNTRTFCEEASKWMNERKCDSEETIQSAFEDITEGHVPPSEFVVLDVAKAVAHRA